MADENISKQVSEEVHFLDTALHEAVGVQTDWTAVIKLICDLKQHVAEATKEKVEAWTESFIQQIVMENKDIKTLHKQFAHFKTHHAKLKRKYETYVREHPDDERANDILGYCFREHTDLPERAERLLRPKLRALIKYFTDIRPDYDPSDSKHIAEMNEHLNDIYQAVQTLSGAYNEFIIEYKKMHAALQHIDAHEAIAPKASATDPRASTPTKPPKSHLTDYENTTTASGDKWNYSADINFLSIHLKNKFFRMAVPFDMSPGELAEQITSELDHIKEPTINSGVLNYEVYYVHLVDLGLLNITGFKWGEEHPMPPILIKYTGAEPEAIVNKRITKFITESDHKDAGHFRNHYAKKKQKNGLAAAIKANEPFESETNGMEWKYSPIEQLLTFFILHEPHFLYIPSSEDLIDLIQKISTELKLDKTPDILTGAADYNLKYTYIKEMRLLNISGLISNGTVIMDHLLLWEEVSDPRAKANEYIEHYITNSNEPNAIKYVQTHKTVSDLVEVQATQSTTSPPITNPNEKNTLNWKFDPEKREFSITVKGTQYLFYLPKSEKPGEFAEKLAPKINLKKKLKKREGITDRGTPYIYYPQLKLLTVSGYTTIGVRVTDNIIEWGKYFLLEKKANALIYHQSLMEDDFR